jgi:protein associated with RNAse G/E
MITTVLYKDLTFEAASNSLVVEASDLGFQPNQWPNTIAVYDNDGIVMWFHLSHPLADGGREYKTFNSNMRLRIFND